MKKLSLPVNIYLAAPKEFTDESILLLKDKRVLLFMNESSVARQSLENWIDELDSNCSLFWINNIASNPTYVDVFNALTSYKGEMPDVIIAVGGGSAIDIAKSWVALSFLINKHSFNCRDVLNSIKNKDHLKHITPIPIYAVPTTAGTGSEVTCWATVWDKEREAKYSIEAPWLYPKKAYIIPEFTRTMPKRLTLSTGLDALCHAMEAYWAKSSNAMVREISKVSIRLLVEYLPKVLVNGDDLFHREKVCLGSLFAGLAFSNTRTTACHSISYPLTMRFGVEHGLACALTLAKVMEMNMPEIKERKELLSALGVQSPKELQTWIDNISSDVVRLRLSSFGIREDDIPGLVDLSFTQSRMNNNPVELTREDVGEILHSVL